MADNRSGRVAVTCPTHRVHIFIDNSNLWIEGQKAYAEKHKLKVMWDPTWRFDIGHLKKLLIVKTHLSVDWQHCDIKINLYGSTPPPVDTVWTTIKSHDVYVSTFARSTWNKREKEVDAEIIADSVEKALKASYEKVQCDFIIVSGDRDLRPAVEKIKKYGFQVHIWSWKKALASVYRIDDDVKVYLLDNYLEEIGFRETTFRVDLKRISAHSIVVLDPLPRADDIESYVKSLRIPIYQYVSTVKRDDSSSQDLVIIPAFAERMKHNELMDLYKNAESTLGKSGLKVLTHWDYVQRYKSGARHGCMDELTISNRFQELPDDEPDSEEDALEENENEDETKVETEANDNDAEANDNDAETNDNNNDAEADDNDTFTRVTTNTEQRRRYLSRVQQKSNSWCHFRKYCFKGVRCRYGHTQEELNHFKTYGPKPLTKFKRCTLTHCLNGTHCGFAHGDDELFCPTCDKVGAGHEMVNCPERSRIRRHNSANSSQSSSNSFFP